MNPLKKIGTLFKIQLHYYIPSKQIIKLTTKKNKTLTSLYILHWKKILLSMELSVSNLSYFYLYHHLVKLVLLLELSFLLGLK